MRCDCKLPRHGFRHPISENEFHSPKPIQPWRRIIACIPTLFTIRFITHSVYHVELVSVAFTLCLWGRRRHWGIPRDYMFGFDRRSSFVNYEFRNGTCAVTLTSPPDNLASEIFSKSWYCLASPTCFVLIIFIVISKIALLRKKAEKNVIKNYLAKYQPLNSRTAFLLSPTFCARISGEYWTTAMSTETLYTNTHRAMRMFLI